MLEFSELALDGMTHFPVLRMNDACPALTDAPEYSRQDRIRNHEERATRNGDVFPHATTRDNQETVVAFVALNPLLD